MFLKTEFRRVERVRLFQHLVLLHKKCLIMEGTEFSCFVCLFVSHTMKTSEDIHCHLANSVSGVAHGHTLLSSLEDNHQ